MPKGREVTSLDAATAAVLENGQAEFEALCGRIASVARKCGSAFAVTWEGYSLRCHGGTPGSWRSTSEISHRTDCGAS